MTGGTPDDKENFRKIKSGTWGDGKTLDALTQHAHAKTAKLQRHHVLALRLYTTSSYARINDPLRQEPPVRPHPFAATTYFISDAIKKLRAVAANLADAHTPVIYWRGMKDLGAPRTAHVLAAGLRCARAFVGVPKPVAAAGLTMEFMQHGADASLALFWCLQTPWHVMY